MSFEKIQTNEYCTVFLISFQEIWKIRMCDIRPAVSHHWKFQSV